MHSLFFVPVIKYHDHKQPWKSVFWLTIRKGRVYNVTRDGWWMAGAGSSQVTSPPANPKQRG